MACRPTAHPCTINSGVLATKESQIQMTTRIRLVLATLLIGCSSSATTPPGSTLTMSVVSGTGQTALRGTALSDDFVIKVVDAAGAPVAGKTVNWSVTFGGGTLAPAASTTSATGTAATRLTLGPFLGNQTVTASIDNGAATVSFGAVATGGSITLVATVAMPTGATYHHDTFVRDGLAFVCAWNFGVRIYDVGNGMAGGSPSNPVLVSSIITSANGVPGGVSVHNAWWFQNPANGQKKYLFVGQEGFGSVGNASSGDIHIVDVSDLTAPVEVGFIHVPGAGTHNFWMDESRQVLYAAYYNAGVIAVDVSGTLAGDMSDRIIARITPGGTGNTYVWGVTLSSGTLYAIDMLSGLWALDPVTLAVKGGGNNVPERYSSDFWVTGVFAYTGGWGTRAGVKGNAIKVWTLAPVSGVPALADSLIIPGITTVSDVAVSPDGKMLIATAEGGAGAGLYVYDRTSPQRPVLRANFTVSQGLHTGEVAVIGGHTYVFAARDPSDPAMMIFEVTGIVP